MKFESKEQRDELIKGFAEKAKELTEIRDKEKKDKNYNARVTFDHRSEFDEIEKNDKGEIISCKGDIYVFYIKQPSLFDSIKILDSGEPNKTYGKCQMAWSAMIMEESSPEVFTDRIKLGYLLKMLNHIDALLGDQKKN